jgi:hypothetical protein
MHTHFAVRNSEVNFELLVFSQAAYTKQLAELILCVFAL